MITRTHFSKFWRVLFFCSFSGNETSPESFLLHNALARKPKRIRTAFSPSQLLRLEHAFEKNHYVVGAERKQLAHSLSLTETQVRDTKCFSHLFISPARSVYFIAVCGVFWVLQQAHLQVTAILIVDIKWIGHNQAEAVVFTFALNVARCSMASFFKRDALKRLDTDAGK